MWFITLTLERITGAFSLSNTVCLRHLFVGGKLTEEETKSWPGKPVVPGGINPKFQSYTSDHCPSSLPAALAINTDKRLFIYLFISMSDSVSSKICAEIYVLFHCLYVQSFREI